jgi:murein DD-endopeptidase MepM/ murein hydrolase activator NlpD
MRPCNPETFGTVPLLSRRYTVVVASPASGSVYRITLTLRPVLAVIILLFSLPFLSALGARWSVWAELRGLRTGNAALEMENASYRMATRELTGQIESLQETISDLGLRSTLDPASAHAMQKLPAVIRSRAMGGTAELATRPLFSATLASPEDTFGVLRDLLGRLESRLRLVETDVERREALAAATPSIWPAHGWLSASYGYRADPFTGERQFHGGIDISTDKGSPVFATADGTVVSANYIGDYGNMVVVEHGFGLSTRYAHLVRFAVKPGEKVRRGTVVGYVGSTGRATGPHVHYEVLVNNKLIDPLQLLRTPRR